MPLSRDEIMTLEEARNAYDLTPRMIIRLRARLEPQALKHLGWQGERGWFYRIRDIEGALDELPFGSTPTRRKDPRA